MDVVVSKISGFIDLAMRIQKENFLPYLTGQKELRPRTGDLTFANLARKKCRLSSSENWKVILVMTTGDRDFKGSHREGNV